MTGPEDQDPEDPDELDEAEDGVDADDLDLSPTEIEEDEAAMIEEEGEPGGDNFA